MFLEVVVVEERKVHSSSNHGHWISKVVIHFQTASLLVK